LRPGSVVRAGLAVGAHPSLWWTALRQWRRTTPHGWWQHRPFLPVPSREYLQFRMVTQYGRMDVPMAPEDVLNYLAWCKQQEK
jgi:hypothetical protein